MADRTYNCDGIECHRKHGVIGLEQATTHSCNNFYRQAARELGSRKLLYYSRHILHLELPYYSKNDDIAAGELEKDICNAGIGQGNVKLSAYDGIKLCEAVMYGRVMAPRLVMGDCDRFGNYKPRAPVVLGEIKHSVELVLRGMTGAATEGTGAGHFGNYDGFIILKTGTAQVKGSADTSIIIVGTKTLCLEVVIENGGWGGVRAAKLARKILEAYNRPSHTVSSK
jgi:cell division protein FtsI/penicillin-binding protein 2